MKKLVGSIFFIVIIFSCMAQDPAYNLARDLYVTHDNNIDAGRRAIENTENQVIQSVHALLLALLSSSQGYATDSADYWKGVFDGLIGETTAELVLSWDAVLVLDRDMDTLYIDSVSFDDGSKWIDNPMDSTDIIDFDYDTIYLSSGAIKQVSNSIIHIIPTADRDNKIIIANNSAPYGLTLGGLESLIFSGKDDYMMNFSNDSTRDGADTTWTVSLKAIRDLIDPISDTTVAHNTRILTNVTNIAGNLDSISDHRTDIEALNDTISDHRADFAPSGGSNVVQLDNGDGTFTADADYTIEDDSARFKHMVLSGNLRLTKFAGSDTNGMYLLPNNTVDTMQWSRSGWALLKENIEPFDTFFRKRDLLGELNWPRFKGDSYHKINPKNSMDQFTVAHERTWVYMSKLYDRIALLEKDNRRQKKEILQLQNQVADIRRRLKQLE